MTGVTRSATLLFTLLLCTGVRAQHHIGESLLAKIPVVSMPAQDNDALLREDAAREQEGRPNRFAVSIPTTIRPENAGVWVENGKTSTWYFRLTSPTAKTLNLGFSEYNLPDGAELYLTTKDEQLGPFTLADNADHNQLWTPVLRGDELMIELRVPTAGRKNVQLYLTSVNHDFKDITKSLSQSCNLDVVCGEKDGWGIVDKYRDIIRSVAAYTLGGVDQCTGFLVNNTNQDGTPYFMTANHCNVREVNDQTVVTYWNYESPVCRQPGSSASSDENVGSKAIFNSGTIFLARSASSDMCLTRLEEPVNPAADAFYAGWSRDATVPSDTVIAIHHPSVHEKRITFSFNPLTRTINNETVEDPEGRYLVVSSWSIGTTEGGSSGSPLFDKNLRVRGQLWRGRAACNRPQEFDQYGFFHSSWEGDGTPRSRLKDWLDPCGIGVMEIDGLDDSAIPLSLIAESICAENCITADAMYTVNVGEAFPVGSTVSIVSSTLSISPIISATSVSGGDSFTVTVPGTSGSLGGDYETVIRVSNGDLSDDITLYTTLTGEVVSPPTLLGPTEGQTEVSPLQTFSWVAVADANGYDFEVSSGQDFTTLITSLTGVTANTLSLDIALPSNTDLFWRVRALNFCGAGDWVSSSFRVTEQNCEVARSTDTPVPISSTGRPTVTASVTIFEDIEVAEMQVYVKLDHSFIGDLSGTLTAPDGRTIQLFDSPRNGGCPGVNMEVLFRDNTVLSSADFRASCGAGEISIKGVYQSQDSLDVFNGGSARGTWTLAIIDSAPGDGGNIIDFSIGYCGAGNIIPDYTLRSLQTTWEACVDGESDFTLELGPSFGDATSFAISTPDVTLTEFTSSVDAASGTAVINFSGWNDLSQGAYDVSVELTAEDGTSRILEVPLRLSSMAEAAQLSRPDDGVNLLPDNAVRFRWSSAESAENYTLQYSADPEFSPLIGTFSTTDTEAELSVIPENRIIYWRIISNNEACGVGVSETRSLSIGTVAVQDFSGDRSISIYPNPVKQDLTVEFVGTWSETVTGNLFDATGRRLRGFAFSGAGRKQFDVSALPEGLYFLRVEAEGGSYTERIVVGR